MLAEHAGDRDRVAAGGALMAFPNLIDGRALADEIHLETAERIGALKKKGIQPGLAFVRAGEDPASKVYVGMKERIGTRLGILSQTHVLPDSTTEPDLLAVLGKLNAGPRIPGILVQSPLPAPLRAARISPTS